MVEIFYKDGTPVPDPNREGKNLSYYMGERLQKFLDAIKSKINEKDKDYVLLIDGYEGSGKSTLAQQMGKYVDPTLNIERICMTADEFKKAIANANKGECVIYDEAVTGMTAGESITRIGRLLKSMMMQMRQKNLFVIVILPIIFEFSKYAVLSRARSFFHVYEKGRHHKWVGYNKKDLKQLYLKGKKNYSYRVRSFFNGMFSGKWMVNEIEYRKKKEDALFLLDEEDTTEEHRWKKQRDVLVGLLIDKKATHKEIYTALEKAGLHISMGMLSDIRKKLGKAAL